MHGVGECISSVSMHLNYMNIHSTRTQNLMWLMHELELIYWKGLPQLLFVT